MAWETLAGAGIGALAGMFGQRQQRKQQQHFTDMQVEASKELTDYNAEKQMEMWNNTNYGAQRKHMEAAGLNVGLMYGMGGGGGTTASLATGQAGSGQAQDKGSEYAGMAIQAGLAAQMNKAQIELLKAQTEQTKVDTAKTAGVDTDNVRADTELKGANRIAQEIENDYRNNPREFWYTDKTGKEKIENMSGNDARIIRERVETYATQVETRLKAAETDNINQDMKLEIQRVAIANANLAIGWKNAKTSEDKVKLDKEINDTLEKFRRDMMEKEYDEVTTKRAMEMLSKILH